MLIKICTIAGAVGLEAPVDPRLEDIKFRTFGCSAAIAVSSMVTEMAKGKPLEEAMKITKMDVADELDGLPPQKMHCSNLGADALHAAINNYWEKTGKKKPEEAKVAGGHQDNVFVPNSD